MKTQVEIDEIVRSRRKTLCLEVSKTGKLIVRAPRRLSKRAIYEFIAEKESWISRAKTQVAQRFQAVKPKQFVAGDGVLYLGQTYTLNVVESQAEELIFNEGFFMRRCDREEAVEAFQSFYIQKAKLLIPQVVTQYAREYGLRYNKIRISNAKKTLGSCSINGNLSFSWRIMLSPFAVVNYLVVHELSHLVHHNHSSAFWSVVAKILPDYKSHKKWLRENHHLLGSLD